MIYDRSPRAQSANPLTPRDQMDSRDDRPSGSGTGLRRTARRRSRWAWKLLKPEIYRLQQQAAQSEFAPERRASFLAPRVEALDTAYTSAGSRLAESLANRGVQDSSVYGAAMGTLLGRRAQAGAQMVNELYDRERRQQEMSQQALRDLLTAISTGNLALASQLAMQIRQAQLAEEEAGFGFGDLLAGLGPFAARIK